MTGVNDWAAKAARRILTEYGPIKSADEEWLAAIIATFAEPLVALLRESGQVIEDCVVLHRHEDADNCLGKLHHCRIHFTSFNAPDSCPKGRGAWNKKIDEALS
jgi:hypothetical protein